MDFKNWRLPQGLFFFLHLACFKAFIHTYVLHFPWYFWMLLGSVWFGLQNLKFQWDLKFLESVFQVQQLHLGCLVWFLGFEILLLNYKYLNSWVLILNFWKRLVKLHSHLEGKYDGLCSPSLENFHQIFFILLVKLTNLITYSTPNNRHEKSTSRSNTP